MTVNFIEVEEAHKRLPSEWQEKFSKVDWSESLFVAYGVNESYYDVYEVTSDDEIFGRHENGELTKLADFTAKLDLSTGVILEEEDYELDVTAYFFKGELLQFKFDRAKFVDREERVEAQKQFQDTFDKMRERVVSQEKKSSSVVYRAWKSLISIPLTAIRYILGFFIKVCFFIEDLLT